MNATIFKFNFQKRKAMYDIYLKLKFLILQTCFLATHNWFGAWGLLWLDPNRRKAVVRRFARGNLSFQFWHLFCRFDYGGWPPWWPSLSCFTVWLASYGSLIYMMALKVKISWLPSCKVSKERDRSRCPCALTSWGMQQNMKSCSFVVLKEKGIYTNSGSN